MKSRLLCLVAATGLLSACGRPGNAGDSSYNADPLIQEAAVLPANRPQPSVRGPVAPERPAPPQKTESPALRGEVPAPVQVSAPPTEPAAPAVQPDPAVRPDPMVYFEVTPEPPHDVAVEEDYALTEEEPPSIEPQTDPQPAMQMTAAARTPPPAAAKPSASDPAGKERRLLNLINAARARRGIAPLKFSRTQSKGTGRCMGSAGHAEYMAQHGRISHDNFPRNICLRSSASAENVAYASGDESQALESAHRGLMNSSGHYKNIMNPNYNTVGLGFFYYKGKLYVTENFLRL